MTLKPPARERTQDLKRYQKRHSSEYLITRSSVWNWSRGASPTADPAAKHLLFVHKNGTSETTEFADPGMAEIGRDFCTPPSREYVLAGALCKSDPAVDGCSVDQRFRICLFMLNVLEA
jgi:hypothetical protein